MSKWNNVVIDDCCDILDHLRVPVNGQDRQNMVGDIPYYGANGLQGYINDFIFNEDLILIAEDGGNFEEYDTRPIAYKISGKSWVNNHAHILKAKPEYCQDYIFYSLVNKNIVRFIAGGTRSKLNKSELIKIPIYCPQNPVEQQKIAKILSTTDTVIEKTQAAISKYKSIKQGMLNDLFTRGINIKTGKLRPKYEDSPELYKESELGWIPKEWNDECLSSLCSEKPTYGINAAAVDYNHHLPTYLRITDIDEDGSFSKTRKKCVDSPFSNQYILKKGDLVFARTGATVGKTYLYDESDGQLVFAGFLIKVSPNEKLLNSNFLKFLTETPYYINWVEVMSQRSGQPGINGNEYGDFLVPKPDLTEQKTIAQRLLSIQSKISSEQQFFLKLQQIKSGLMADLLSGNKLVSIPNEIETQMQNN
jgi:type I restriction enzyme S subunit